MNICIGHLTNCATEHFLFCSQIITTYNLQRVFMALVCLPNYVGNKATYMSMLFKQIMELHFPSCYHTTPDYRWTSCISPPATSPPKNYGRTNYISPPATTPLPHYGTSKLGHFHIFFFHVLNHANLRRKFFLV